MIVKFLFIWEMYCDLISENFNSYCSVTLSMLNASIIMKKSFCNAQSEINTSYKIFHTWK